MKYCPICETRYDEEIIRFCTKDGTPLVDEEKPNFIQMPSESLDVKAEDEDDAGEVTVIRRNVPVPKPPPDIDEDTSFTPKEEPPQRIVVPTTQEPREPQYRPGTPMYYPPPPQSNTFKVVVLTILGTAFVLGGAAGVFFLLQSDNASNTNSNVNANLANVDTNLNTNLNLDTNFNFNLNSNFNTNLNANANANANVKTPTPTPKPSPSPSPSPTETPDEDDTPTPTRTPAATPTPIIIRPGTSPTQRIPATPNRSEDGGVLNGRAIRLPTPTYPPIARQMRASGEVRVLVAVDERGNVISAKAITGHPLLRSSAEAAALRSRISPARINNQNVRTNGVLLYNFASN